MDFIFRTRVQLRVLKSFCTYRHLSLFNFSKRIYSTICLEHIFLMIGSGGGTLDTEVHEIHHRSWLLIKYLWRMRKIDSFNTFYLHIGVILGVVNSSLYSFSAYVMNIMSSLQMVGQPLPYLLQRSHHSLYEFWLYICSHNSFNYNLHHIPFPFFAATLPCFTSSFAATAFE